MHRGAGRDVKPEGSAPAHAGAGMGAGAGAGSGSGSGGGSGSGAASAGASRGTKRRAESEAGTKQEMLIVPLGAGAEVGRSCHILKYKGKTIMVSRASRVACNHAARLG